ncbi:GNAT family N-acetyltransferase [Xinfangfangia sp. D13-10-4-6]|uniref:GNAT family N-acetyltransferase n=1 Tax=Pseudogemmobacter hezensis TaxID=2737662 RepID=UPI00155408BA|nr:GNAT family N-acetyltransferase [Pseudogemmobacter hezensis]NPD14871.1 GNAT family N-acetyltransferase [Pseudogemmobacter hezensis]
MAHDATPPVVIRDLISPDEKREAFALFRTAMLGLPDLGATDPGAETRYLESGAFLGAFEADRLRAVANGYASEITLPGGASLPHLSVTHVGTGIGATRRGFARSLLAAQLQRARAAGLPLAGLRASDARIYGRYGFGIGSWSVSHELDLTGTRPLPEAASTPLRAVDPLGDLPLLRRIAETEPAPRPARLARWDAWWEMQAFRLRHAPGVHHAVVVGPPGAESGYLRFHSDAAGAWFTASERRAVIDDFVAHDAGAWRTLIHYLFSRDILHRVIFPSRPEDDPLPLLIDNPRALQIAGRRDESWIRILDPETVLAALPVKSGLRIELQVKDPVIAENNRVYQIGDRNSAIFARISISVADLSSWIFGAVSAAALLVTDRISASADTVAALDSLHPGGEKPWSGISF